MRPEQDPFRPIGGSDLEAVTGGRISKAPDQVDPNLIRGIGELAKAVQGAGQALASVKSQSSQGMMQIVQQMMQMKGGR